MGSCCGEERNEGRVAVTTTWRWRRAGEQRRRHPGSPLLNACLYNKRAYGTPSEGKGKSCSKSTSQQWQCCARQLIR